MSFLSKLFRADPESAYKTCIKIYNKAKMKKPGKQEQDYLKFVLITKPPFDYQFDAVINLILDNFKTIHALAEHIAYTIDPDNKQFSENLWISRERNIKFAPEIKKRNENFFIKFWN